MGRVSSDPVQRALSDCTLGARRVCKERLRPTEHDSDRGFRKREAVIVGIFALVWALAGSGGFTTGAARLSVVLVALVVTGAVVLLGLRVDRQPAGPATSVAIQLERTLFPCRHRAGRGDRPGRTGSQPGGLVGGNPRRRLPDRRRPLLPARKNLRSTAVLVDRTGVVPRCRGWFRNPRPRRPRCLARLHRSRRRRHALGDHWPRCPLWVVVDDVWQAVDVRRLRNGAGRRSHAQPGRSARRTGGSGSRGRRWTRG